MVSIGTFDFASLGSMKLWEWSVEFCGRLFRFRFCRLYWFLCWIYMVISFGLGGQARLSYMFIYMVYLSTGTWSINCRAHQESEYERIREDLYAVPSAFHSLPFHEYVQKNTPVQTIKTVTERLLWHHRLGHPDLGYGKKVFIPIPRVLYIYSMVLDIGHSPRYLMLDM